MPARSTAMDLGGSPSATSSGARLMIESATRDISKTAIPMSDCKECFMNPPSCNPQAPGGAAVAGQAPTVQDALHAHLGVVAEHGGTLLPRFDDRAAASGRVHQR